MIKKIICGALHHHLAQLIISIFFPNMPSNWFCLFKAKHTSEHLCIFTCGTFIEPTFFCGRLTDEFFRQMVVILWENMNYFIKTVHSHDKVFMILAETHIARKLTTQKHMFRSQFSKFAFSNFNGRIGICEQRINFINGHMKVPVSQEIRPPGDSPPPLSKGGRYS